MSQALATRDQPPSANAGSLIPRSLPEAMRMAEIMANARMVPKHLQGDVGSCFMIVEQAQRWNMSPFLVAQCTSNIGGKLCYEGKLIAAAITSTGGIIGEFDYEFIGSQKDPKTLSVKVSALRASDRQRKEITLSWAEAKTENKYWVSQPEQQLTYAGARVWARRWTPGPMLGVYAPEEQGREFDVEAVAEAEVAALPDEPHDEPPPIEREKPQARQTIGEWLAAFKEELAIATAQGQDAVNALCDREDVKKAAGILRNGAKKAFDDAIADALDRTSGLDTRSAPMET